MSEESIKLTTYIGCENGVLYVRAYSQLKISHQMAQETPFIGANALAGCLEAVSALWRALAVGAIMHARRIPTVESHRDFEYGGLDIVKGYARYAVIQRGEKHD